MIDLADAAAVAAYGQDARDAALLDDVARALPPAGLDDFLRALDALERAVSTLDPKRTRRAVGWLGRMFGDDIQAQADGEALRARMGVLLADARREAERVQASDAGLAELDARVGEVVTRLEGNVDAGRAFLETQGEIGTDPTTGTARFQRRLDHLATLAASHRITQQHLRLARTQCAQVLERHAHLHELLGPTWTQHRIATRDR